MSDFVFDSHALLKLFQQEKGYQRVLSLLESIQGKKNKKYINIINFSEIIYITKKRFGNAKKIRAIAAVQELGFEIEPATDELVYQAAEIKGDYALSFADCFSLVTAIKYQATLVTGDPEFRAVEKLAKIYWCP